METIYLPQKKLLIIKENGKITKAFGGQNATNEWNKTTLTINSN